MSVTLSDEEFEIVYNAVEFYNNMSEDADIEDSILLLEEAWKVLQKY
jgi:hypothetical protein